MGKVLRVVSCVLLITASLWGQGKRLWVLRSPGEMVEYDPATFAAKQTVKLPAEAMPSPQSIAVNRLGQMLFAKAATLPLAEEDAATPHKFWIWNGHSATSLDQGLEYKVETRGSNQAVTESAPVVFLSADGSHLFWFGNQTRRLQRENIDLSTTTTWLAWQTDLSGGAREEIASLKLPECRCPTGTCEESCPSGAVWVPEGGVDRFFLMTQFIAGQTETEYKVSTRYQLEAGKWSANVLADPLQKVLDTAGGGSVIVAAIPDTGCCGWSNESNDQTLVVANDKTRTVFDERASYQNPDYDVSFYTSNALLSPELGFIAMTINATSQADKPIQLAEEGQANPQESLRIRKALAELPAVEVKSMEDSPRRVALVPHAALVGWISEKELLIVQDHLLMLYNLTTGARRKSTVRVEDAGRVFLR